MKTLNVLRYAHSERGGTDEPKKEEFTKGMVSLGWKGL